MYNKTLNKLIKKSFSCQQKSEIIQLVISNKKCLITVAAIK